MLLRNNSTAVLVHIEFPSPKMSHDVHFRIFYVFIGHLIFTTSESDWRN